ncbi:dienelactone hydrolase family protein [Cyanobium gracile]|uniref:Dienelactone hydrolase family protein n=1 Tax=Cyanobium gracile UHCC 0281 TaxID=3110309 RepID=A0ABU5SW04_9CYAN|nr:dienelactone hydrolase family protein [Cyanobium gracile]MEA5442695.1 dienelactone hydrolase family protein [Cyanobium gracile UHCC 0281]
MSPSDSVASWLQIDPLRPDQVPLRCWWARPAGTPPRGGVLVLPEVFGINGWIRSVAQRLAEAGYGALAVPLYARTAPELELGYGPDDLALGRSHKERTRTDQLLSDVGLAADWLQQQLPASAAGLGCVGFCFGGHVALLAATLPAVAVTVDFYGAGVATGRPGGGPASLELLPSIGGTLLCVCGAGDPLIPPADVAAMETALSAANAARVLAEVPVQPHRLVLLEGGHGFMCSARPDHCPEAAEQGWSLLLEAFEQVLGAPGGRG